MMKTIIKHLLLILILLGGMASCNNPEDFKDVIYFTGTDESPILKYSLEEPESIGLSVRSSTKVSDNVKVGIRINEALVEKYNEENGTSFKVLPQDTYSFDASDATIEAGKYASDPFYLNINSVDDFNDEDTYCLPVEITDVKGGSMSILESSRVVYVIVNKTIITQAAVLSGTYFYVDFSSDPGRDLSSISEITMEARIFVDGYQDWDPYISTIMGCEENFLLRLGDVKIPKEYLQFSGGAYPVSSVEGIPQSKWVHVAVTYDGKRTCLYIDGSLNAYVEGSRGPINIFDGSLNSDTNISFYIGTTSNSVGRTLNGKISEARVWTRALSEAEIANNICAVAADSPDLLAYWKFNTWKDDVNNNVVVDYTGHGYDAIGNQTISWVEGVRCP